MSETAPPSEHEEVHETPWGPAALCISFPYYHGYISHCHSNQDMNRDVKKNLVGKETGPEAGHGRSDLETNPGGSGTSLLKDARPCPAPEPSGFCDLLTSWGYCSAAVSYLVPKLWSCCENPLIYLGCISRGPQGPGAELWQCSAQGAHLQTILGTCHKSSCEFCYCAPWEHELCLVSNADDDVWCNRHFWISA